MGVPEVEGENTSTRLLGGNGSPRRIGSDLTVLPFQFLCLRLERPRAPGPLRGPWESQTRPRWDTETVLMDSPRSVDSVCLAARCECGWSRTKSLFESVRSSLIEHDLSSCYVNKSTNIKFKLKM